MLGFHNVRPRATKPTAIIPVPPRRTAPAPFFPVVEVLDEFDPVVGVLGEFDPVVGVLDEFNPVPVCFACAWKASKVFALDSFAFAAKTMPPPQWPFC